MLPILEQLPSLKKRAMPLSVEAWHQMINKGLAPDRAELIRGVIIEKMSKSILHTKLTDVLAEILRAAFSGAFWVRQESPLTLSDSEPEPDVSIVDGRRSDYDTHPSTARLVVEVSVSTLAEDRVMADLYAEASVSEYWIVNATERCIEVFRDPEGGHYTTVLRLAEGAALQSPSLPDFTLLVADLFAGVTQSKS